VTEGTPSSSAVGATAPTTEQTERLVVTPPPLVSNGLENVSADSDFAGFPGLAWSKAISAP